MVVENATRDRETGGKIMNYWMDNELNAFFYH